MAACPFGSGLMDSRFIHLAGVRLMEPSTYKLSLADNTLTVCYAIPKENRNQRDYSVIVAEMKKKGYKQAIA